MRSCAYIGAFLDVEATWRLLAAFPPRHATVHAHHVTLAFKPRLADWVRLGPRIGEEISIGLAYEAADDLGQAVRVVFGSAQIRCENTYPHITISTAPGVKPVYSNDLLAQAHGFQAGELLWVKATIDTFPRTTKETRNG